MAANFLARTALSTMRGGGHDTAGGQRLDRTEIEVLENGAGLALDERVAILLYDDESIAKNPISDGCGRFVEHYQIDRTSGGVLQPSNQVSELERAKPRARIETHGNIEVAARVCSSTCARPEHERVVDARIFRQHL